MPRRARVVFPGVPHHITQRGIHRSDVFFQHADGFAYLDLVRRCVALYGVDVVAYCLMPNHVHLVLVPSAVDGLHRTLKVVHGRYAQRINRIRERVGHLWQNRFFSSPLDSDYFLNAVKYVELNPVRAKLVDRAEDYPWSSAAVHCGKLSDPVVGHRPRSMLFQGIDDWSRWLASGLGREYLDTLRSHSVRNLPCGSSEFVEELEAATGTTLRWRSRGRPRLPPVPARRDSPFLEKVNVPIREKGTVTLEKR